MANVYLVNFSKSPRSTSQPNISNVTPFTCKFKIPCSIVKPVIEISMPPASQAAWITGVNYAYLEELNRYYFIADTVMDGNIIRYYLSEDVLATWKNQIKESSQYVLRASADYDGFIIDTKYPVKAAATTTSGSQALNPFIPSDRTGCFVLGIVSKWASITGCVVYYAMSMTAMGQFMTAMFNLPTQWGSGGADLADGLKKAITDPMQYVVSAMWFPFTVADLLNRGMLYAGMSSIPVGYDNITINDLAYPFINDTNVQYTGKIDVQTPRHPLELSRGNYMNYAPFSRYYLSFYPFCDLIELDSTLLKSTTYLVYHVDMRTGIGVLSVSGDFTGSSYSDFRTSAPQRVVESQIGVQIPLATIHTTVEHDLGAIMMNAVAAAGSYFGGFAQMGNRIAATINNALGNDLLPDGSLAKSSGGGSRSGGVHSGKEFEPIESISMPDLSNIASQTLAMSSTCEALGSQGTMSLFERMPIMIWGEFFNPAPDNLALFGRPLCQTRVLNTLTGGYVICDNPKIGLQGALLPEVTAVQNMMQSGFYLE